MTSIYPYMRKNMKMNSPSEKVWESFAKKSNFVTNFEFQFGTDFGHPLHDPPKYFQKEPVTPTYGVCHGFRLTKLDDNFRVNFNPF